MQGTANVFPMGNFAEHNVSVLSVRMNNPDKICKILGKIKGANALNLGAKKTIVSAIKRDKLAHKNAAV